jgi:hypothetical protein
MAFHKIYVVVLAAYFVCTMLPFMLGIEIVALICICIEFFLKFFINIFQTFEFRNIFSALK